MSKSGWTSVEEHAEADHGLLVSLLTLIKHKDEGQSLVKLLWTLPDDQMLALSQVVAEVNAKEASKEIR